MRNCCEKWFLVSLLLCSHNIEVKCKNKSPQPQKDSLVEVRAVFINCESDGRQDNLDSPNLRFERQELFKHNALRGCNKKLALTVKIASADPAEIEHAKEKNVAGDEYIPIDHVFEGSDHKRVRLLNPYILRLRRELPKQAYKLHRIDTVSGVLTNAHLTRHSDDNNTDKRQVQNRERRDLDPSETLDETELMLGSAALTLEHDNPSKKSYSVRIGRLQDLIKASAPRPQEEHDSSQDCGLRLFNTPTSNPRNSLPPEMNQNQKSIVLFESDMAKGKRDVCPRTNCSLRENRQNQVMMTVMDEVEQIVTPKYVKGHYYQQKSTSEGKHFEQNKINTRDKDSLSIDENEGLNENKEEIFNTERTTRSYDIKKASKHSNAKPKDKSRYNEPHAHGRKIRKHNDNLEKRVEDISNDKSMIRTEKEFAVYEIGNPNLWYDVKVHLFEKLSTPEGKTVWNDLTKGEDASVSSANPEWKGQDVNVRYRPAEWVPRDDFTLPTTRLCLLEPLRDYIFEEDPNEFNSPDQNYIVVPIEDVVYLESQINLKNRDENVTAPNDSKDSNDQIQSPRQVEVRVSRAIMGSRADNFDIAHLGSDRFLTIPHRRPHHSQIDVEVRADDNVLVRVGSSGRLATVVTDNTRKKRTTVYFQATNTGLASARFKGVIRECGPEVSTLIKQQGSEEISSDPILLPPHHTRRLKLDVPVEIPTDVTHCNVALVNDEDESVAVRDVSIKKGDRCFCVWHCECVCLSDDPKLLCREMSQTQQVAAGLSAPSERSRRARSVCYEDNIALDFVSVLLSVLIFLLMLGLIKAFVGLWNVRAEQIGWERLLGPRLLDCYHEPCLRHRVVVYKDGWPVHPDTKQRTVRTLSCPASFLVNLVFFIAVPCIAVHSIIKECVKAFKRCYLKTRCKVRKVDEQIYSAHDLQSESLELIVRKKRKRNKLTDWMSPFAEKLTADVLKTAMDPTSSCCCTGNNEMQPLLNEKKPYRSEGAASAPPDSEQEDTEYVLMQMQKSRESLARSQKKLDDSLHSTERNNNLSQTKGDTLTTTRKN